MNARLKSIGRRAGNAFSKWEGGWGVRRRSRALFRKGVEGGEGGKDGLDAEKTDGREARKGRLDK